FAATICSAPVNSEVSPNEAVPPAAQCLSMTLPTVGQLERPVVVSDSPHFTLMYSSCISHSVRCSSDAHCTYSLAWYDASAMVRISPLPSIEKPFTGLPVWAIPSTMRCVQPASIPITTTAATLG